MRRLDNVRRGELPGPKRFTHLGHPPTLAVISAFLFLLSFRLAQLYSDSSPSEDTHMSWWRRTTTQSVLSLNLKGVRWPRVASFRERSPWKRMLYTLSIASEPDWCVDLM